MDAGMYKLINAALCRLRNIFQASRGGAIIAPPRNASQPSLAELSGAATALPTALAKEPKPLNIYTITPKHVEERQFRFPPPLEEDERTPDKVLSRVSSFTMKFDREAYPIPEHWEKCIGPDGKIYFRHRHDDETETCPYSNVCSDRKLTVYTNNDVRRPERLERIQRAMDDLLNVRLVKMAGEITEHSELVLDVVVDSVKQELNCGYYFVPPGNGEKSSRFVFWGEEIPMSYIVGPCSDEQPVLSSSQLVINCVHAEWQRARIHIELFPQDRPIPSGLTDELHDHLLWLYADVLTGKTSLSRFTRSEISAFLTIIKTIRDEESGQSLWALARPMHCIKDKMFTNYYGEHCARLNLGQSIFPSNKPQRSWLLLAVSIFLFWIPDQCMTRLDKIWVDGVLHNARWNEFLLDKKREWEKTLTPATVLLSANVGFLAIQSIDSAHGMNARNVAQVASYVSMVMSLGSYMTGHILSLQHSREVREQHDVQREVVSGIRRLPRSQLSLYDPQMDIEYLHRTRYYKEDRVALIYSLPSALFLWSILSFFVAMSWAFFDASDTATRAMLAVLCGLLFLIVLVVACMEGAANSPKSFRQQACIQVVWLLCGMRKRGKDGAHV